MPSIAPGPSPDTTTARLTQAVSPHGRALAALAASRGLVVTAADGRETPIGISATPIVVGEGALVARQRLAARLSSATVKMARAVLGDPHRRALILDALSPLERAFAAQATPRVLATTRVDFFQAPDRAGGGLRALEVNATIPAMQGYSDIAADAYLETVGRIAGVSNDVVAGWRTENGSNTAALLSALVAGHRQARQGRDPAVVAILARRQDAQLGELRHLAARFSELGVDARVVHPDDLSFHHGVVSVDGRAVDLLYRHLFVRRLEERGVAGADVVTAILSAPDSGTGTVVLNAPASQVEVKAVFALLSESIDDEGLAARAGLHDDERAAIASAVPWTRLLRGDDVVARVQADPARYVLKRSWDYGGRTVLVGRSAGEGSFVDRVRTAWPDLAADPDAGHAGDWATIVARAAADLRGGGFIVQELVDADRVPHVLCTPTSTTPADVFVDFSLYASVGIEGAVPWGGVCRTSISNIVNIVGGGGVAPVLRAGVADAVVAALSASQAA